MKTIINLIIAVFAFGLIFGVIPKQASAETKILIHSVDSKVTPAKLSESAKIISARLKNFSTDPFELIVVSEKHQIEVIFKDGWDLKAGENLMTQKGSLSFYAPYKKEDFSELLKGGKGALLTGSDVESVKTVEDKASGKNELLIEFKKPAVQIWADATRRNLDKAIAIVLDNKVIYSPVLKSVIEGGKCSITGNFTKTELQYLAALCNNGELPVRFKVIK